MTSAQIEQVIRLQEAGKGYRTIASELGLSINSVKSWCRRHPVEETPVNGCKQCSAPLIQFPGKRKRFYCSDRCRYLWWAAHPECGGHRVEYKHVCRYCGAEFTNNRKAAEYCGRSCFAKARMKVKPDE